MPPHSKVKFLEGAVECLKLRASGFQLSLADTSKRSSRLWVIGQLLPFSAPASERGFVLRANILRNLGRNTIVIGGEKAVALSDTDRVART